MKRALHGAGLVFLVACGGDPPPVAPASPPPPPPAPPTMQQPAPVPFDDDSLLYLEEVSGDKALAFAREHDAVSEKELTGDPGFKALQDRLFAIYSSKDAIPAPSVANGKIRNFWTDADNPRGLWRETTLAEYKKPKPAWTLLLDVDALGKKENQSYVYHGSVCLYPKYTKCLVRLSKGGGDADIVREFDAEKKAFVEKGFVIPEAKTTVAWKDENTLFVASNFGPGTMTKSGYARTVREWKRGTDLAKAPEIFAGKEEDVGVDCHRSFDHDHIVDYCERGIDFERHEVSLLEGRKLTKVDKPDDAEFGLWSDQMLLRLKGDWTPANTTTTYKKGTLLITDLAAFMKGKRDVQMLFEPTKQSSLAHWVGTKTKIAVNVLTDVKNGVTVFSRDAKGKWTGAPVKETAASINVGSYDRDKSDDLWVWLQDFTLPSSLVLYSTTTQKREQLKQNPTFFEASGLSIEQHFATSKDGTKIPYFEIGKKERKVGPALLTAYGGFEISLSAFYSGGTGAAWLERGGTFIQANIRGGGEYGPAWHEAAMKHNRQVAYDDLEAVAEDLVTRGVTTAKQLGVMGGSNGGLLTSVMLTQKPELFGAVVSRVPLTDMKRFHKLLAGASWMSEYGDPENAEDWDALAKFSPLQNIKRGRPYPPMFYTTSTKDDRVHPAHARKMVAKLEAFGYKPLYYENIEGGHGGAADVKQRAYVDALIYTFLGTRLGMGK